MGLKIFRWLFVLMFLLVFSGSVFAQTYEFYDIAIRDFVVEDNGGLLYFVAEGFNDDENIYLGAVDLGSDGDFVGTSNLRVIGSVVDNNVLSVDYGDGVLWVGFSDKVVRYSSLGVNKFGINSASNYTYNSSVGSYSYFRDVVVHPSNDEVAYACRVDGLASNVDFYGVEVFKLNSSSDELEVLFSVSVGDNPNSCRGLEFNDDGSLLFVDNGVYGLDVYDVGVDYNLSLLSDLDFRLYFQTFNTFFGRKDVLGVSGDYLFVSDGGTGSLGEAVMRINVSNASSPVYDLASCELSASSVYSRVSSLEVFNESIVFLMDSYDDSIYACSFVDNMTTYAVKVWSNPYGTNSGDGSNLVLWSDGGVNYFYSNANLNFLYFYELLTTYDVGGNNLPYFTTAPDEQFVSNLNPVAVGVEISGLDSAEVRVYPLSCRNPNIYDCSRDVEGDKILFAVDKDYDGSFDVPAPKWWGYEGFSTTYDEAGNYTMRIYLTDDKHPNVYLVYRDFEIVVRNESVVIPDGYDTLKFKVMDSVSFEELENVYVSVGGVGNSYTNVVGETAEVVPEGVYTVSFSKNGYVSRTSTISTSSVQHLVYLDKLASGNRRTLSIVVKDSDGGFISGAYIQTQTKIYNTFDYKFTDDTGSVVFFLDEDNVVVTVDADDYRVHSFEVNVPLGSSVSRVVTLSEDGVLVEGIDDAFLITGCQDYISGVLLCDYDKVECVNDSDCLTDYCVYSSATGRSHCSNFNWNLCDSQGMYRGNRCVYKNIFLGFMRATGVWIVDNFFFVLILVLLLVAGLVLAMRYK